MDIIDEINGPGPMAAGAPLGEAPFNETLYDMCLKPFVEQGKTGMFLDLSCGTLP